MKTIELNTSYKYRVSKHDGITRIARACDNEVIDSKVVKDEVAIVIGDKVYRLFDSLCAVGWDENKNTIELYLYFEDFMETNKEELTKELL